MPLSILKIIFIFQKKIMWGVVMLFVMTLFAYAYFVNGAILNIVERQNVLRELASLTSSVGELESDYSIVRNTLTQERARALGFDEPKKKVFVSEKRLVQNQVVTF